MTPAELSAEPSLTIHNDEVGMDLLWLCSRDEPDDYDGRWEATVSDIAMVEEMLLQDHAQILRNAGITEEIFRNEIVREYAGFTRKGRRYLYGSFGPTSGIGVCDGGPAYFGVEFAMPGGEVTHVAHNGMT